MGENYPRLCGGTFLTLLLEDVKPRSSKRDVYHNGGDGLSNSEIFEGLVKIINPDYIKPKNKDTLKNQVSDYRKCEVSTAAYLPFDRDVDLHAFDDRVKNDYGDVLQRMIEFTATFLSMQTEMHKDLNLVKALLDLIDQDESISDDELFYVTPTGNSLCKKDLVRSQTICFESFLLGVWHYAVEKRRNNMVGKDTFNEWCPQLQERSARVYRGHMGENFHDITLSYAGDNDQSAEGEERTENGTAAEATVIDSEQKSQTQGNITVQIMGKVGNVFNGPINGDLFITNNMGDDDDE